MLCSGVIFGQSADLSNLEDSLTTKDYQTLRKNYTIFFDSIPSKAHVFAKAYIQKAKLEKKAKELQNGYILMTYLVDNETAIKYCDSTITIATGLNDQATLAKTNFYRGSYYFDKRDFKEALDCFLKADKLADAVEDEQFEYFIKYSIGALKVRLSKYNEAKEIFNEIKTYLENRQEMEPYEYFYLSNLHALSNVYRKLNLIDSSSIVNRLGHKEALMIRDSNSLSHFIFNEGINYLEKQNFEVAMDSMMKGVRYFEKKQSNANLIVAYYHIGRAYDDSGNELKGMQYFKRVDSLFKITNDLKPETRDAYDRMISFYRNNNNQKELLGTIESLLRVDSVLNTNYRYLNTYIIKKYDTPQLISEKEKLIASLNKGKKNISRWLYVMILLLLIAGVAIFYYIGKQKQYKKRFEELVNANTSNIKSTLANKKSKITSKNEKISMKDIGISEDLVHDIQAKLDEFVENKGYLENSITLNSLSKQLNTNSKYLSKLINHYEQKNFSKYINDLRIDYTVSRLQGNNKFRKYAIKAIANEVGFNNTESFSKAFYKKTGIYPSYFIKQLEKSNNAS
jgi:AraC-like DNA-binding protein